jgi:hypothetical protein
MDKRTHNTLLKGPGSQLFLTHRNARTDRGSKIRDEDTRGGTAAHLLFICVSASKVCKGRVIVNLNCEFIDA